MFGFQRTQRRVSDVAINVKNKYARRATGRDADVCCLPSPCFDSPKIRRRVVAPVGSSRMLARALAVFALCASAVPVLNAIEREE
jgi:hypothetical protein